MFAQSSPLARLRGLMPQWGRILTDVVALVAYEAPQARYRPSPACQQTVTMAQLHPHIVLSALLHGRVYKASVSSQWRARAQPDTAVVDEQHAANHSLVCGLLSGSINRCSAAQESGTLGLQHQQYPQQASPRLLPLRSPLDLSLSHSLPLLLTALHSLTPLPACLQSSSLSHLLSPAQREAVADAVNSALLAAAAGQGPEYKPQVCGGGGRIIAVKCD
jgi:hypothetical protein